MALRLRALTECCRCYWSGCSGCGAVCRVALLPGAGVLWLVQGRSRRACRQLVQSRNRGLPPSVTPLTPSFASLAPALAQPQLHRARELAAAATTNVALAPAAVVVPRLGGSLCVAVEVSALGA